MSGAGASFVSPAVAATGGAHTTASQLGDARSGKLADNLTGFGRALRRAGVPLDAARMALAQGMQVKAVEFQRNGGQLYVPLKAE